MKTLFLKYERVIVFLLSVLVIVLSAGIFFTWRDFLAAARPSRPGDFLVNPRFSPPAAPTQPHSR